MPSDGLVSLEGPWHYRPGDDLRWAAPGFDDQAWDTVELPLDFRYREIDSPWAWYRKDIDLAVDDPREISDLRLGIAVGKVDSAYEIYVDGRLLGGAGALPPEPFIDWDRHRIYPVPNALADDARLVIALRVWSAPETPATMGVPFAGPLFLGPEAQLVRRELLSELPSLFFAGWFLIAALVHLELYRRRSGVTGYLWFALFSFGFGGHTLLRTQWKYWLTDDFLWLKELEHAAIHFGVVGFIQLIWPLLGVPIGRLLRAVQALNILAIGLVFLPGVRLNLLILPFWQVTTLGVLVAFAVLILRQARAGNPEALSLTLGSLAVLAGFIYDIWIDRSYYLGPVVVELCFVFFVASLAVSLAGRYVRAHTEVENLRRSEQAAEEANRAKTEFLAHVSHEIRTPMTGILGAADLLLTAPPGADPRKHAGIIRTSAGALLGLIDDLLDFSKIESGKLEVDCIDFDPADLLRDVVDLMRPRAEAKGIALRLDLPSDLPQRLVGDPLRLRQVLLNLLSNGVKFTEQGSVDLQVNLPPTPAGDGSPDGVTLRFAVRDTGIGIAPETRHRLFQPFQQAERSIARRFGGTGLGLPISRRLVELLGGTLELESEPGRGSVFRFDLRFELAAPLPEHRDPTSVGFHLGDAAPYRLLLAEDTPISRLVLTEQLNALGLLVESAGDGREVLERLHQEAFDLVLMDCQMPEVDGYEATRRIRRLEGESRRLPIVALTARAMPGDREECLAAGMDDYLTKPFQGEQLTRTLERWLPEVPGPRDPYFPKTPSADEAP